MTDDSTVNRLIKDPIALAILLTVPVLVLQYSNESHNWPHGRVREGWHFGFLFDSLVTDRTHYNFTALIIIWAVAIIRWKWQKEDKA